MTLDFYLSYAAALVAVALAGAGLARTRRLADISFVAGMLLVAAERWCGNRGMIAASEALASRWHEGRLAAWGLLPALWLCFSITYARGEARAYVRRWRLALLAFALIPAAVLLGFRPALVVSAEVGARGWVPHLGWAGLVLLGSALVGAVLVLVNFERTFRASVGAMRWRIKFTLTGVGLIFVVMIYTSSQGLLFRRLTPTLDVASSAVLLLTAPAILRGLFRSKDGQTDVYPSQFILQGSITILLVGLYFMVVGVFAQLAAYAGGDASFAIKAFFALASLVALAALSQSDRVRLHLRRFVSRHFQRPIYDYREIWRKFTDGTAACVDQPELCRSVVRITAEVFQALSVSIWLVNEQRDGFVLAASTSISEGGTSHDPIRSEVREVLEHFEKHAEPVDVEQSAEPFAGAIRRWHPSQFLTGGNRVCVPLVHQHRLIGVLIMGDRVGGSAFPLQDFDLLKCVAEHTRASLLNLQLSQHLLQTKEFEAFQTMAAFFVHDLKNAASTLNLTLQNIPAHFSDPRFKEDALRAVDKSAKHINSLIGRLSQLRHELRLQRGHCDLNNVARAALAGVEGKADAMIVKDLADLPPLKADEEQLKKVAINLVLNASEAIAPGGEIRVSTRRQDADWIVLSVADNGCGMSPDFMRRSLFRPFQTTKKSGLGIGMFQSRMIVEAHGGRMQVTSEPQKGTTFEVHLPTRGN